MFSQLRGSRSVQVQVATRKMKNSNAADNERSNHLTIQTCQVLPSRRGGTIGLPLEMGWGASWLFADEANVADGLVIASGQELCLRQCGLGNFVLHG